jgi:hypothetical protein
MELAATNKTNAIAERIMPFINEFSLIKSTNYRLKFNDLKVKAGSFAWRAF